jgi:hypothetical protein
VARSTGKRPVALIVAAAAMLAPAAAPLGADASTYGRLVARHDAAPSAPLQTSFAHARAPRSFLLVVTESTHTALDVHWSLRCVSASGRESGGASGQATVTSGRWVKRVRPDWIRHPASCAGSITGSAATSPVLVRVFAD